MKTILTTVAATALVLGMSGAAFAGKKDPSPSETTGNPGNGNQNCVLANGDTFKNPAAMLKALTDRDGSFQNTVDLSFESVGDLIDQKCGVEPS